MPKIDRDSIKPAAGLGGAGTVVGTDLIVVERSSVPLQATITALAEAVGGGGPASSIDGNTGTIQIRRKTSAEWTSDNTVLAAGEIGIETDTLYAKVGNGVADWVSRPYAWGGADVTDVYDGGSPSDVITETLDGGAPGDVVSMVVDGGSPLGSLQIANVLMRRGTAADWASTDPVLPIAMFGALLVGGVVSGVKVGDDTSPWSQLQWFVQQPWLAEDRAKLDGIAAGAQVNPTQVSTGEKNDGALTDVRGFSPRDVADMAADFGGGGGSAPAQVNTDPGGERDLGTLLLLRSYTPADIRYMAERFALLVSSVHGRTGAVVATTNDYTAAQIQETSVAKIMTGDERTKLATLTADGGVVAVSASITLSVATHRTKALAVTSSSVTITVPSLSGALAFSGYDVIPIYASSAVVTVLAGSGVTIVRADGSGNSHQIKANSDAYLRRRAAADSWVLVGALV